MLLEMILSSELAENHFVNTGKPSFRISFDHFVDGQRYDGLEAVDGDANHLHPGWILPGLKLLEQWHFLSAGGAPGSPEIDEQGAAGPLRERPGLALEVLQGQRRQRVANPDGRCRNVFRNSRF